MLLTVPSIKPQCVDFKAQRLVKVHVKMICSQEFQNQLSPRPNIPNIGCWRFTW